MHDLYDVVVVGGGIIGKSIAFELARASVKVLLIYPKLYDSDSASLASGAMLGAYGEITAEQNTIEEQQELEFRILAQKIYPSWLDTVREESGQEIFTKPGTFIIINNAGDRDRANIKLIKAELDTHSEPNEWVNTEDVPGLDPNNSHTAYQALFIPGEGSVDSQDLLTALEEGLYRQQYSKVLDDKVTAVNFGKNEGEWSVQTEKNGYIFTSNVVLCAGARIPEIISESLFTNLKVPDVLFGKGTSCILTDVPDFPHTIRTPNRGFACGLHAVPRNSNRLYIGATNTFNFSPRTLLGVQSQELLHIIGDAVNQINTALGNSRIEQMRFGLRPITSDGIPLFGQTLFPGLFLATGTFRNGMLMAPLIAQIITAELLNKQPPTENIFSPLKKRLRSENQFERLVDVGPRSLMDVLREPGGLLPFNRTRELESFIRFLFEMSIAEHRTNENLREKTRQMLRDVPLDGVFLAIYYEFIRTALPEAVPQVKSHLGNGKTNSFVKSDADTKVEELSL